MKQVLSCTTALRPHRILKVWLECIYAAKLTNLASGKWITKLSTAKQNVFSFFRFCLFGYMVASFFACESASQPLVGHCAKGKP